MPYSLELAFRIAIIMVSLYNIGWTWKGPRAFSCGIFRAPYYVMSFVFFASFTTLGYEAWHLIDPGDSLWRVLLFALSLITGIVGIAAYRAQAPLMTDKYKLIYLALPQSLAIATLVEYDPEAAARVVDECWALIRARVSLGVEPTDD